MKTRLLTLLAAPALSLGLLAAPAHASGQGTFSAHGQVRNAFTELGHNVYTEGTGASATATAVFELRNDSPELASLGGTVDFLDAGGAVLASKPAFTYAFDTLPGAAAVYVARLASPAVKEARFTASDTAPVARASYRDLTATAGTPTTSGSGSFTTTDYPVTVTNTGLRPATFVYVQEVTRNAAGKVLDVTDRSISGDLAPGATGTATISIDSTQPKPNGDGNTATFTAFGDETSANKTFVAGKYDPDTVGGLLKTTWTVTHLTSSSPVGGASARIVRFTPTTPYQTVAQGTTGSNGVVTLRFTISNGYLYSFLVDGTPASAPYRFNQMTLRQAVTVKAAIPSKVTRGKVFSVKGKLVGGQAGDKVRLQRKSRGSWVNVASAKVGRDGSYKIKAKLTTAPGKVGLRVFAPNTPQHFSGLSAAKAVRIR